MKRFVIAYEYVCNPDKVINHERSKDVLVIVCFCSLFIVFMVFCFSRPA